MYSIVWHTFVMIIKKQELRNKTLNFFLNVIQIMKKIIKGVTNTHITNIVESVGKKSSHFSFHLITTTSDFHSGLKRLMLYESCVNILFIWPGNIF